MTGEQITPSHRQDVHIRTSDNRILQVIRIHRPLTGQEIMNSLRSIQTKGTAYIAQQVSPRNGVHYFRIGRKGNVWQQHCIVRVGENYVADEITPDAIYTTFGIGEYLWGSKKQFQSMYSYEHWIRLTCEQLYLKLPK